MSCVAESNDRDILVSFSSFLFSRLSATDQCEKMDEIRQKLAEDIPKAADGLPEESEEDSRLRTFTEVIKNLAVAEQNLFLSSEMNKYKKEGEFWKLCFWFQQLEADDQRELLEKLDPITPGNVQIPRTSDGETKFRIDRFKQLPAGTPKIRLSLRDTDSIFKLSRRSFIPQQDFVSASQLLSHLSTFGFSLLPGLPPWDRKRVAKFFNLYGRRYSDDTEGEEEEEEEEEEDLTMTSFTELYNDASFSIGDQVFLCNTISETFFDVDERRTREFIFYFRQLGTKDQEELIEKLFNRLVIECEEDASDAIIEKFAEESEEDFRDRRFINLCVGYPFIWMNDPMEKLTGAGKWDLRDLQEPSLDTKFLNGFSNIWAKARCPNDSRNPIHLILHQAKRDDIEKLIPQGNDIEKLPDENMADFRVRRFTESFNRLQFSSQEYIVKFIQDTVFQDVGIPLPKTLKGDVGSCFFEEDQSSFVPDLIKFKAPNLRGEVGLPPTSQEVTQVADHLASDFETSMG